MSYFFLILLGSIWGASYLLIKIGGEQIPPITLVAMRTTIAGLALLGALAARRDNLPPRNAPIWKWLALMGLLNSVVPYTLITWGELHISSGLAAILVGMMPIFTVMLAHWMTHDEKMTARKVAGILVGFAGVIILFLPDLTSGLQWSLAGGAAVIIAAVSYAFAAIYARRHFKGESHVMVAFGQMLMASAALIPASLIVDRPWTLTPTPLAIGAVATLAVLGTGFAYLLYYWLISHVGATRTALVTYISPVVALVLGAVFLNESWQWTTVGGLVLIIAGVGLVTNMRLGTLRPTPRAPQPLSSK